MNKELPEGWEWTSLGETASRLQAGGTPSTKVKEYYQNGTINYVKIEDMASANKYLFDTKIKITKSGLDNCSAWIVPENSLLYSMYASYGIPVINKIKVATNQAIIAFIPPEGLINLDYIYYYLLSLKPFLKSKIRGTTQENLNANIVTNIEVPLPPLPEQQRIVEEIEELFTNLDKGIEYLKTAQAELKIARQSVLKYAMEGKLTEKWREENKDKIEPASVLLDKIKDGRKKDGKYKELPPLDTSELSILPEGWIWSTLAEVTDDSQYGWTTRAISEGNLHLLRTTDITSGRIEWDTVPFCEEEPQNIEKYLLLDGDIVISRAGSVGYSYLIKNPQKSIFASYLIRFKPKINQYYLSYFLKSPAYWNSIYEKSIGIALPNVNASKLKQVSIPLPPLPEQQRIVEEIETYFSILDNMENTISQSLHQTSSIRQSILKKAFEGKLVPQDPNDEPASILLQRIKAEKNSNIKKENYQQLRID